MKKQIILTERTKKILFASLALLIVAAIVCVIVVSVTGGKEEPAEAAAEPVQDAEPIVRYVTKVETKTEYVDRPIEKIVQVPVEKKITTEILQEGLLDMGELVTQEYWFNEVTTFESTKTYVGIIHLNSKLIMGYEGCLKAGIDFTAVRVKKDDAAKTITVTLPETKIISCELDYDSFKVYEEDVSRANPIKAEDYNGEVKELVARAQQRATERGILDKAAENAQLIIKSFIAGLVDLSEYKLVFANS